VHKASDVGQVALLGGHPQVRGAGVENHPEVLRRRADGNGSVVLGVHVVGQRFGDIAAAILNAQLLQFCAHIGEMAAGRLEFMERHTQQSGLLMGHGRSQEGDQQQYNLLHFVLNVVHLTDG